MQSRAQLSKNPALNIWFGYYWKLMCGGWKGTRIPALKRNIVSRGRCASLVNSTHSQSVFYNDKHSSIANKLLEFLYCPLAPIITKLSGLNPRLATDLSPGCWAVRQTKHSSSHIQSFSRRIWVLLAFVGLNGYQTFTENLLNCRARCWWANLSC